MNEIDAKKLLEEARGYLALGLTAEAEAALRTVMADAPDERNEAQGRLIFLLNGGRRFREAADLGADLIARGALAYYPIIHTMLALNYLGKITEARETLRLVEKCGHPLAEDGYQMACFAARLKEFPEALRWLCSEFRRSSEYHKQSFADTDLRPFWTWLRDYTPTLEEAHFLIETPFKDVCAAALAKDAPIELSADDLARVEEPARRLFRYDFEIGSFVLNPLAVAADPETAADFVPSHREGLEMVRDALKTAHGRAVDVVLDAQPRYAAEHAAWGNHLGARYHILWALNYRPTLIADFLTDPGLDMMQPFLLEALSAPREDREFLSRMHKVQECNERDPDRAWELLDETPEKLHTTALYQLRLAGWYQSDGDYERALPLWAELRRRWPNDAVGWSNAIICLQKLNRLGEARELLATAPACYRRFRLYVGQVAILNDNALRYCFPPVTAFRGQPDLGGVVIPEGETKPEDRPSPEANPL